MYLQLPSVRCASRPLALLATLCIAAHASSQSPACTLRVHVDGFRNTRGVAGIVLFSSSDGWPEDVHRSYQHKAQPIQAVSHSATITFDNLPPGDYGVVALHDENSNMKLDRNLVGWPKEGFGFSNNPHVGLGAPSYRQAIIKMQCPATDTTIHIQYK